VDYRHYFKKIKKMAGGFLGGGTSVGAGIGLQASPEGDAAGFGLAEKEQSQAAAQRKLAAERLQKAREKQQALTEKGIERMIPYQTAMVDQQEAQGFVNDKLRDSLDAYSTGDHDAYYKVAENLKDVKQKALENQPLIAQEKAAIGFLKEADQTGTTNPYLQEFAQAIQTTTRDALKDLAKVKPNDPTGQVVIDPKTGHYLLNPAPKINTMQVENQLMNKALTDIQQFKESSYVDPKGGIKNFDVTSMPETRDQALEIQKKFNLSSPPPSVDDAVQIAINDPAYRRRKEVNYINSGVLPTDYLDKSKEERDKLLTPIVKNDLIQNGRVKITPKVVEGFKPESSTQKQAALGKVRAVYNEGSGILEFGYSDPADNKPIVLKDPKGNIVKAIPKRIIPNGPGGHPGLVVDVEVKPESKFGPAKYKEDVIGYDQNADQIRINYGDLNYFGAKKGEKPKEGTLETIPKAKETKKAQSSDNRKVPTASMADWKKAGWTEAQIVAAVKQNKIKVE
jgi:hypothetical protein